MLLRVVRCVAMTIVLSLLSLPVLAADGGPAQADAGRKPLAEVAVHVAPVLDLGAVRVEDEARLEQGLPFRYAVAERVTLGPDNAGTWETLADGRSLWRLRITNSEALSLNLGFTRFWLPADAALRVYGSGHPEEAQVYGQADQADHGELWTPVILANDIVVELETAPELRWMVDLELGSIGRGYRFFGEKPSDKSGSCNIDVICPAGDDWRDEIDTVGVISRYGTTLCTGFMINNTANDAKPLFYTAFHCGVTAAAAPTLVVYWNFQSPVCGQQGGGLISANQNGSTLLAASQPSDFTLVELDDDPDPTWGVKFAGWNRSNGDPSSAVAIHHPSVDEKSISFENDPVTTTSYFGQNSPGDGTHLWVKDWDQGTTEGGSSGSPLFDQNHHVVGSLHGGAAACGNDLPDWYGRLSAAWTGGGSPSTRLSDWLDPLGTGTVTLELHDPSYVAAVGAGPRRGSVLGQNHPNPFNPMTTIGFTLPHSASVNLHVHDVAGRLVRVLLADASVGSGAHEVVWDGRDTEGRQAPSGVYYYRLETGDMSETKRMVLLK